ncbi:hypothetical protein LYSHEL_09640 [Lysobacter helvus]|uniref:Uncharacterized protein n=2 Tax=Lysobacteraceae TaxID=32033 RepID=A0ABN6FQN3_9GAMM|nr:MULTISPECIES: hypothetical protein [Lysobacter]BCT91940.1 hypothetical protein LYSCAS_09640 [Lysobacter caseinilyticus]BCT95093.1 hypothetical protein LYSHEL_09640 [Lysobacter helvus]
MPTQRPAPRSKPRNDGTQSAAQQSAAQALTATKRQVEETDRQRNALENQGAQGRGIGDQWTREKLMRENDDDETATRH